MIDLIILSEMHIKKNKFLTVSIIVILSIFSLLSVWFLYKGEISFDFRSNASARPDFIICPDDNLTAEGCTVLYSGSQGLYNLFHDSVNLDLNNDGEIYIVIREGLYKLNNSALTSVASIDREWISLKNISKSVLVEGQDLRGEVNPTLLPDQNPPVVIDGSAFVGGIDIQKSSNVVVSGIKFDNLATNTTYCSGIEDCLVGRVAVVDAGKLTLKNVIAQNAALGSVVVLNNGTLNLEGTLLKNTSGVGALVKDTSTLNLSSKSKIESDGFSAVVLQDSAKLIASSGNTDSSYENRNVIKTNKNYTNADNATTILAKGSSSVNLSGTNVQTLGKGIAMKDTSTLKIENSEVKSNKDKSYIDIELSGSSKLLSMKSTTLSSANVGLQLLNNAVVDEISGSYVSNNKYGIKLESTVKDEMSKISKVENTTIGDNVYTGIWMGKNTELNLGKNTVVKNHPAYSTGVVGSGHGLYLSTETTSRIVNINKAEFRDNLVGIRLYEKTPTESVAFNIADTKIVLTENKKSTMGIRIDGASNVKVSKTLFEKLVSGISLATTGGKVTVLDSEFLNNSSVGILTDTSSRELDVIRNKFKENVEGIKIRPSTKGEFRNNIFESNGIAAYFYGNSDKFVRTFANNIVANSTNSGLKVNDNTKYVKNYNNVYMSNIVHITSAGTLLESSSGHNVYYPSDNTMFVKFTPQISSFKNQDPKLNLETWEKTDASTIIVNKGNPEAIYNDRDGSRNDIGLFGGPYSPGGCGNGVIETDLGEECDGSSNCNSECKLKVENESNPVCGNSVVENGELCDDGSNNGKKDSKCDTNCEIKCGNSIIDEGETCDLGESNGANGSNCSSTCVASCGDGVKQDWELCDYKLDKDKCSETCTIITSCGNGKLEKDNGEKCDDGNVEKGDGCSNTCEWEADANGDGKVSIAGDYMPLYKAIKKYLFESIILDARYDLNKDNKITINGDYILFLKYYKFYLKSLL